MADKSLWQPRWWIAGQLKTQSPLHIGSGETMRRLELTQKLTRHERTSNGERTPVDIAAVALDHQGRAYIPGTTLKGDLRAFAVRCGLASELAQAFGLADKVISADDKVPGVGGKLECWDAPTATTSVDGTLPPYWSAQRLTGVASSVALSRRTRTASDARLFHREYVPRGVSFDVTLAGALTEAELLHLLALLNAAEQGLTLGASTNDGWGRVAWHLRELRCLDGAAVQAWLLAGASCMSHAAARTLDATEQAHWVARAAQVGPGSACIGVRLQLQFAGPFLVNDTSRCRDGSEATAADAVRSPHHAPRLDHQGRPFLPASSLRGVLRSQAERILRTLGGAEAACTPDAPCAAVHHVNEVRDPTRLCRACRVFGAAGWRSPLLVSDFMGPSMATPRQEFLAIDRFTGGGAEHLKFDAETADRPVLAGEISLDLEALGDVGVGRWALGLLALTLRDLLEGDLTFGFGAAKGFGACEQVEVEDVALPPWARVPEAFRKGLNGTALAGVRAGAPLPESVMTASAGWLAELRAEARAQPVAAASRS